MMTTKPKVSVVIGARNEYPQILATIFSFVEEFEHWDYPYEIIVVDNMSTDNTVHILRDKMRRWIREGKLKVIEYNDAPANVTVRNVGAREATGEVVFLSDAHVTISPGTLHGMIQGWLERGGLWHSAMNIWGDTSDIKNLGYDLRLTQKFWGNLSRGVPEEIRGEDKKPTVPFYRVPMASHCCLMAGRKQYLEYGGYCEEFKCYGGGEPYLDLLWWLMGSEVYIYAKGLVRHAFGLIPKWREISKDTKTRTLVHKKNREQSNTLKKGDSHLSYSRGYSWKNDWLHHNFMMSAYTIGGYEWLKQRYESYFETRKGNPRYVKDLQKMRIDVLKNGKSTRDFIQSRQVCTLDELVGHDSQDNLVVSSNTKPWEKFDDLGFD